MRRLRFTAGPWIASHGGHPRKPVIIQVSDGTFREVATIKGQGAYSSIKSPDERAANARLISVAPQMFEILQTLAAPETFKGQCVKSARKLVAFVDGVESNE